MTLPAESSPIAASPSRRRRRLKRFVRAAAAVAGVVFALAALLVGTAGHWIPWLMPWVSGLIGPVRVEVGALDLFPLHRAEVKGILIGGRDQTPGAEPALRIGQVRLRYGALGELCRGRIEQLEVEAVEGAEGPLLALVQTPASPAGAAPAGSGGTPVDWDLLRRLLVKWAPRRVEVKAVKLVRPSGEVYELRRAELSSGATPDGSVQMSVYVETAPLADMLPFKIPAPFEFQARLEVQSGGIRIGRWSAGAGPLIHLKGTGMKPLTRPTDLSVRLSEIEADVQRLVTLIGGPRVGGITASWRDIDLRVAMSESAPEWAPGAPPGCLLMEVRLPMTALRWEDFQPGWALDGGWGSDIQVALDPAERRVWAIYLARGDLRSLKGGGIRAHDASLRLIGSARGDLRANHWTWQTAVHLTGPLDQHPLLTGCRGAFDGRTSGSAQLSPPALAASVQGRVLLDRPATGVADGGTTAGGVPASPFSGSWPIEGLIEVHGSDELSTMQASLFLKAGVAGGDVGLEARGGAGGGVPLATRVQWSDVSLADLAALAGSFVPIPGVALEGRSSGRAEVSLSGGRPAVPEMSVEVSVRDFSVRRSPGAPLSAFALEVETSARGRGWPWALDQGPVYEADVSIPGRLSASVSNLIPLRADLTAWRAASVETQVLDVSWLAALTSQSLPLAVSGGFGQRGTLDVSLREADDRSLDFRYSGSLEFSELSVSPFDPRPPFSVQRATARLDVATSGTVSPRSLSAGFRLAPTRVEIGEVSLSSPPLYWAFFEGEASARGRVEAAWSLDGSTSPSLDLELGAFSAGLPGVLRATGAARFQVGGSARNGWQPRLSADLEAEVSDASSLGWQLGVWGGEGDIRARLEDGHVQFDGDRVSLRAGFAVNSPEGQAPGGQALWEGLSVRGDVDASSDPALTDYRVDSTGSVIVGRVSAGGATVEQIAARWRMSGPRLRFTLDSASVYGGRAWAVADVSGLPAAPSLSAQGELMEFDLENFTENYKTGGVLMLGRLNGEWRLTWDFQTPLRYYARLTQATPVIYVDKPSVRWIVEKAFGGGVLPLGTFSPIRTLDREYRESNPRVMKHKGVVMVPFMRAEAESRYEDGRVLRNHIILHNPHFHITLDPNVERPVIIEFLQIAQSDILP